MNISKIKVSDCVLIFETILLVPVLLVQQIASVYEYYYVRWILTVILSLLLMASWSAYYMNRKMIDSSQRFSPWVSIVFAAFVFTSLISSFLNRDMNNFHVGMFSIISYIDAYLLISYSNKTGKIRQCIYTIFIFLFMICAINDILMAIMPNRFAGNGLYILYSKYNICYLHLLLISLSVYLYGSRAIISIALWIITLAVSFYTKCGTGTIGVVAYLCLMLIGFTELKKILMKPVAVPVFMICSGFFTALNSFVLDFPIVRFVVVNVLGKSIDLTSRIFIYKIIDLIVFRKPIFGFGLENNYAACQKYLVLNTYEAAPDVQNGLFDLSISYGVVGTIVFMTMVTVLLGRGTAKGGHYCFIALALSFIVMASVEIPYGSIFFLIVLLYAFCSDQKHYPEGSVVSLGLMR